jgi:MFS family permease
MARPSWLLALAMTGDALLYALLPLMPEVFGADLAWAGVLLAANRIVRIFAYTQIARLTAWLGVRRAATGASIGAVLATVAFAVNSDPYSQLAARVIWGLTFATINLVTFAYAASVPSQTGRRLGTCRATIGISVTFTLLAGCAAVDWIGAPALFAIATLITLACVPLALSLKPVEVRPPAHRSLLVPLPGRIDIWGASQGFVLDGVFIVSISLLLKESVSALPPALAVGVVFSLRWIMETFCAPVGGRLADRYGATRVMLVFGGVSAVALFSIGFGFVIFGAVAAMIIRGLTNTVAGAMVVERNPGDPVGAQSVYSTYRDVGAAFGPILTGLFVDDIDRLPLYLALGLVLGGTTLMLRR